jgi:hypothetical protein
VLAPIGMVEGPEGIWDLTTRARRAPEGTHHRPRPRRKVRLSDGKLGYVHQQMGNAIAQLGKAIVICPDCRERNRIDDAALAPGTSAVLASPQRQRQPG